MGMCIGAAPTAAAEALCTRSHLQLVCQTDEQLVDGTFYLDGSALDGPSAVLMRCGWVFAAVDKAGRILAAAYGATPPWVTDIGGAEAWALLQATYSASPAACSFISDCKVMVDGLKCGKRKSLAGSSTHVRVYALMFNAIDDLPVERIIWMPAHQAARAIGRKVKSGGAYLTAKVVKWNGVPDKLAKMGC